MRFLAILMAGALLAGPVRAQTATASPPASAADIAAQTQVLHTDIAAMARASHNDAYAYSRDVIAAVKALPDPTGRLDVLGTKLDLLHGDLAAVLAALKAAPVATTAASATTVAFPDKPGDAPFPSPENSSSIRVGAEIQGAPYLRNAQGSIYRLLSPVPAASSGVEINGRAWQGDGVCAYQQLLVRQGGVWMQACGGQWQYFSPDSGSVYNGTMPDAWSGAASSTTAATTTTTAATAPAPNPVAPGSSGRVLTVGAGQQYPVVADAINAAQDGDTIDGGTRSFHEAVPALAKSLLIKGGIWDFTDVALAQGKGGFVCLTDCIIDGVDATGAGIHETQAGGTAAVRPGAAGNIIVRNSSLHGNQNGIAGGGYAWTLVVQNTTLDHNGLGDGYTHNLYATVGTISVTLTNVSSTNPAGGHAIKSRAPAFSATGGTWSATDATVLDLPNGTSTLATVTGVTMVKPAGSANHGVIGYGVEGASNGVAGFTMKQGSIQALCDAPFVQGAAGATMNFDGVVFTGAKVTQQGAGTVTGLP